MAGEETEEEEEERRNKRKRRESGKSELENREVGFVAGRR